MVSGQTFGESAQKGWSASQVRKAPAGISEDE